MPNTFTTLTNTILAQKALEAFTYAMTPIRAFATNFSAEAVQPGDKVKVLFVNSADAALDFSGTYTAQDVSAEGKDITINARKYVSWTLTTEELATQPQLELERFAMQKGNALAKAVLADIWSQITAANYGNTDQAATAGTNGDKVVEAVADFDTETVAELKLAADEENWPEVGRSIILGPGADFGLLKDSDIIGTVGYDASGVMKSGKVGQLFGFDRYTSNFIPANSENLYGFACVPDGMLVAMRVLIPDQGVANRPSVEVLTDPGSGMSIVMREWFEPADDRTMRILECNYGYRVGNPTGVKRLVSS